MPHRTQTTRRHTRRVTPLLVAPLLVALCAVGALAFGALAAGAQTVPTPGAPAPNVPATGSPEPLQQTLATFERLDGAQIVFLVGATDDDLGYVELVPSGGVLTFPTGSNMTFLDRYLALSPANAPVPRALVLDDERGSLKIGSRQIVQTAGHHQLDLPVGDEGSMAIWECGAKNTQANFETAFCTGPFPGSDVVMFCDSQLWVSNTRWQPRETAESVTGYCGLHDPLLGIGGILSQYEWLNTGGGWSWHDHSWGVLLNDLTVFVVWSNGSPTWKRVSREVFGALGSFRTYTRFYN